MNRFRFLFFLLLLLPAPLAKAASDDPARYYAPPSQTNASIMVMDRGFANITALFKNATGRFTYDDKTKNLSDLRLAIDASSLLASNPRNQDDLSQLLDAFTYTEIQILAPDAVTFTNGKADIKATLTMHGQSKPVTLTATLNRFGKSPQAGGLWEDEGDAVGLSLRAALKRADFGMADSPDNQGRFGDTLTLQLDMQAIRQ